MKIDDMKERKNEKGFVLVLTLVTMVAMTVIGVSLMMNMNVDMGLARNERDSKQAFQLAEAGINEAISRLHLPTANAKYVGELAADSGYRSSSWNSDNAKDFGYGNGNTSRQSAEGLNYSVTINYLDETNSEGFCDSNDNVSPNNSGNASTSPSTWTCDNATPEIVMFGRDFKVADSVTRIRYGKLPVYRIVSTGTSNGTSRTIEAYLGASSLNTDTEYGLNTNQCITANGTSNNLGTVLQGPGCGCDPSITGACAPNKTAGEVSTVYDMQYYLGDDLSAIINMADEKHFCSDNTCSGAGDDIPSSGSIDSIVTDWGDFATNTYSTMIYIDNDGGGKEASLSGNYTGRGILIVTGDLSLSGNFQYEGLIYVFGTLTIGGGGSNLNVTGGVMANNAVTTNGGITVNYDQQTLLDVARESSSSALMIWKRL